MRTVSAVQLDNACHGFHVQKVFTITERSLIVIHLVKLMHATYNKNHEQFQVFEQALTPNIINEVFNYSTDPLCL